MIKISDIQPKEIIKGFTGRFVHTDSVTLGFFDVVAGAELPTHSHIHEQITQVLEGQFELTINGEAKIYEKGLAVVIPSNVPHSGRALTYCKILDVFSRTREDYK